MKNFIHLPMLLTLLLSGCLSHPKPIVKSTTNTPKHIFVFFDGTANDKQSNTNVWQLHNLIREEEQNEIVSTYYIEGVGAKGKPFGMTMGWGTGFRIKSAYQYLAKEYQPEDKVYLIGFSRGAYQARILAAMLYYGGLPIGIETNDKHEELTNNIYDAYKGKHTGSERRRLTQKVTKLTPISIEFLGLWDSVEALGTPDYTENTELPNTRYGDQLCNVKRAAHAVSLDDNRANIFTPILLTHNHLLSDCDYPIDDMARPRTPEEIAIALNDKVSEVWFSGAHADVGGGYNDSALNGVSLNWMISQINAVSPKLLVNAQAKETDENGTIHEPESDLLGGAIYKEKMRSLYAYTGQTLYNDGYLKVHHTVIERLKKPEVPIHKPRKFQWWLPTQFPLCFEMNKTKGYDFIGETKRGCNIDIVSTN